jgi:hypothetical protein
MPRRTKKLKKIILARVVHLQETKFTTVEAFAGQCGCDPEVASNFLSGEGVWTKIFDKACSVLGLIPSEVVDLETSNDSFTINPFNYSTPVPYDQFYGREGAYGAIADIKNSVGARTAQCINIVGLRKSGKTSLLLLVNSRQDLFFHQSQNPIIVTMDLCDQCFHTPSGLTQGVLERIREKVDLPNLDLSNPFSFNKALTIVRQQGFRLIVMLDEFESIKSRLEYFEGWGSDWRAKASAGLFAIVIASRRPLGEIYTSLGLDSPFENVFRNTTLGSLEQDAWTRLVEEGLNSIETSLPIADLAFIRELAGQLPFYTQMVCSLLWQYGDLSIVQEKFKSEALPHFNQLWKGLTHSEQEALNVIVQEKSPENYLSTVSNLKKYGLLLPNGQVFSKLFVEFVRMQKDESS